MSRRTPRGVALIGAGRLARALARALPAAGRRVLALASRRTASARRLAAELASATRVVEPARALRSAPLILLAVPDDAIAPLAEHLAKAAGPGLERRVVLHHAGRLGPEVLAPLAKRGAAVGVLHPLQTLADPSAAAALAGSLARVEGRGEAARAAVALARDLGMIPVRAAAGAGRRERELYHAAASLAANDLLALLDLAVELMTRSGIDRRRAASGLARLMQGALRNAERLGPAGALTGPVARGDGDALVAHLARLGRASREAERLHRQLSARLVQMALAGGRLDPRGARELRRLLRAGAGPARDRRL